MGHHAQDVAVGAANASDIFERSVGICFLGDLAIWAGITEDDAIVAFEFGERYLVAKVIAFHVADGDGQHFTFLAGIRERRVVVFHSYLYRLANILQSDVAHEGAGEKPGFTQNLEAVADAEDEAAGVGELAHGFHDGRELGDGAGAEVVAIGEAPGNDDGIAVLEIVRVVPEESYGLFGDVLDAPESIVIAVGTGENYDAEFHISLELRVASRRRAGCTALHWLAIEASVKKKVQVGSGAVERDSRPRRGITRLLRSGSVAVKVLELTAAFGTFTLCSQLHLFRRDLCLWLDWLVGYSASMPAGSTDWREAEPGCHPGGGRADERRHRRRDSCCRSNSRGYTWATGRTSTG